MKTLKAILDAMELTISMTVWKSPAECLGYLKAIREIRFILNDLPNIPETLSKD